MGARASRHTLNGVAGSGRSGVDRQGIVSRASGPRPSFSTYAPGESAQGGGTRSFCSNDDQIHCGRLGVFCAMCMPTRPIVVLAHPPSVRALHERRPRVDPRDEGGRQAGDVDPRGLDRDESGREIDTGRSGRGMGHRGQRASQVVAIADNVIERELVVEREGADVAAVLRGDRRIEHANTGLTDVVDARERPDDEVAEAGRNTAQINRRRVILVERGLGCQSLRRNISHSAL